MKKYAPLKWRIFCHLRTSKSINKNNKFPLAYIITKHKTGMLSQTTIWTQCMHCRVPSSEMNCASVILKKMKMLSTSLHLKTISSECLFIKRDEKRAWGVVVMATQSRRQSSRQTKHTYTRRRNVIHEKSCRNSDAASQHKKPSTKTIENIKRALIGLAFIRRWMIEDVTLMELIDASQAPLTHSMTAAGCLTRMR
jgi:hypothetical protein